MEQALIIAAGIVLLVVSMVGWHRYGVGRTPVTRRHDPPGEAESPAERRRREGGSGLGRPDRHR